MLLSRPMPEFQLSGRCHHSNVVAVLGSQSSGKSTLLNGVFGTTFDVMNENQRRQTTKGQTRTESRSVFRLNLR